MTTLNDYQAAALQTARQDQTTNERLINGVLGLAGEAGEVADLIKKHLHHGHTLNRDEAARELGDVLWYVAVMAEALGVTLEDVATMNILKLRSRYPQGFDSERSKHRTAEAISDPSRCSYCGNPAGSADCQRSHP